MSTESPSASESPYPRENWWAREETLDAPVPPSEKPPANDPNRQVAFELLRDTATILCRTTLLEQPWNGGRLAEAVAGVLDDDWSHEGRPHVMHAANAEEELSEPALRPPTETAQAQRYRVRVNEETGYLTGHEGSTGVVIADRPLGEFMAVVNLWLEGRPGELLPREKQAATDLALSLKRNQSENGKSDLEILTRVVAEVRE